MLTESPTVEKTINDLKKFCLQNSYLIAVYIKKETDKSLLKDDRNESFSRTYGFNIPKYFYEFLFFDIRESKDTDFKFDDDYPIICKIYGDGTDYKETDSKDKKFVFRLHNNGNLPNIIPCFSRS